jgi:hypothetical protein
LLEIGELEERKNNPGERGMALAMREEQTNPFLHLALFSNFFSRFIK